jgi:hypothetical protein
LLEQNIDFDTILVSLHDIWLLGWRGYISIVWHYRQAIEYLRSSMLMMR